MKYYKYLLLTLIFSFTACEVKEVAPIEVNKKTLLDYYQFLKADVDGFILVQAQTGGASDRHIFTASSYLKGNNGVLNFQANSESILFSDPYFDEKTNRTSGVLYGKDLSTIYGDKFDIYFQKNLVQARTSSVEINPPLYIPELIEATFEGLRNGKVVAGTTIRWNSDPLNSNGVVLAMEFEPSAQQGALLTSQEHFIIGDTFADNGFYTVTDADIAQLPEDSRIYFYVARAGYNTFVQDGQDYSVAAITSASMSYPIE